MKHLLAALVLTVTPAVVSAQGIPLDTAAGPALVSPNPGRVVVLDPAAIDTLSALGVTIAGVPAFSPPPYLAPALDGIPAVGTLFEPDFEALAVLGPDLIVAGGRSQRAVAALARIAPTLDMTIWGNALLEQGLARLHAYGALFGKEAEAEAEALAATLAARIDTARQAMAGRGRALILMTNGGTVSAYGADSRFGWLHTATGLAEAYPDLVAEIHGEAVSFEFIAQVNPDWILVIDRGAAIGQAGEAAAATLDNPLVMGTTAGQTGQIVALDSGALYLAAGGVQATLMILDRLIEAFGG